MSRIVVVVTSLTSEKSLFLLYLFLLAINFAFVQGFCPKALQRETCVRRKNKATSKAYRSTERNQYSKSKAPCIQEKETESSMTWEEHEEELLLGTKTEKENLS